MSAETGTLWVCGAATKGLFISCPISKRVRSINAAGRKVAVTLDDGNVLGLDLAAAEAAKEEAKGPETDNALSAVPWSKLGHNIAHTCISSGTFGLVLSTEGEVFSWGDSNKWGELGLGGQFPQGINNEGTPMANSEIAKVSGSLFGKNITKVATGSTHAVAVSESGTLYSWGRGFEGQTGTTNLGVVLSPKLVKFSSEIPIAAVSCGHNFTICVTRQGGQLYAFGEGGCGQLGIGKCVKFSDKAVKCSQLGLKRGGTRKATGPPQSSGGKHSSSGGGGGFPAFIDVTCGWAHAMARNERNEVYVWGLNAHGQLGLGHTDSIHLPMLLKDPYADTDAKPDQTTSAFNDTGTEYTMASSTSEISRPPLLLKDISAYGLASAGVRADGRVMTWGCARGGRLGHGAQAQQSVFEPKLVDFIAGQKISVVRMSADEIVAFAPTTLVKLEPTAGPIQGNSRFAITGSGLWSSDKIVVRFEPIPSEILERMYPKVDFEPFTRPRSTIGKFHYDHATGLQSISCRTPNMGDTQKSLKKYMASADSAGLGANSTPSATRSSLINAPEDPPFSLLQPPHPQPMTISVSMNGIDFVPVGEKSNDRNDGNRNSTSRSMSVVNERSKRGPVTELRNHGIGPDYKHRALYNFYSMAPFQLTSVHPRLLTLPSSSLGKNLDPPVYLYIGGVGLYETSSIAVRLTAPGKKAIVCTTADVVFLRKNDDGTASMNGELDEVEPVEHEELDTEDGADIPSTGLYVRLKVNDAIRELDESGRLPFETSSIAVAMNGQDFVALQGHRDDNSVMFYRARLDTYTPSIVPAIAPSDSKDTDTVSGVPITIKGSGFFRVANRASCNNNTWHLRLRLTDPLPKDKNAPDIQMNSSFDNGDIQSRRKKKLGPDVLVPCRYEDVNTLTALLPPFPLRSAYLTALNKRKKPKGGLEKWPKPWPSVSSFQVEVCMASDDAKLLKLWEAKLAAGVEAPSAPNTITSAAGGSGNDQGQEQTSLIKPDHLKVYSIPGMSLATQGTPSFALAIGLGQLNPGKMVEIVMIDPNFNLFDTKLCLVRFAFTNKEGTSFIRDTKKATKGGHSSSVAMATAALAAAQSEPQVEDEDDDDEETLEMKAKARQDRLDEITSCEADLKKAEEIAAHAASETKKSNFDWYVDVPAIVEQVIYTPENSKILVEKRKSTISKTQTRWVIRCKAPGLKKRNTGGVDFDMPHQTLESMNNSILNALNETDVRDRRGKKDTDAGDAVSRAKSIASATVFGEPAPASWNSMPQKTHVRVFVAMNGKHFHEWPANASVNDPPQPIEDKNKDSEGAEPPVKEPPLATTVFTYIPELPTITSVDTPRGAKPGKEIVFNGKHLEVVNGISKVKFIKLIPIPESELSHLIDEDIEDDSSQKSGVTVSKLNRRKQLSKSYQDGPCAVVPCVKKSGVSCEIPWLGDDPCPMRVEVYLEGLPVAEIPPENHIRSQIPYPKKPTFNTIDIEYGGSAEEVPPPEPTVDPTEELSNHSQQDENDQGAE